MDNQTIQQRDSSAPAPAGGSRESRRFRPRDILALQRLQENGPLTIPDAYDCGHENNEARGHGMNRLVGAGLVFCAGWDPVQDDALWHLSIAGKRVLSLLTNKAESNR